MMPVHLIQTAIESERKKLQRGADLAKSLGHTFSAGEDDNYSTMMRRVLILFLVAISISLGIGSAVWESASRENRKVERKVPAGINDPWRSADVTPLVAELESEGREIYRERERLAALISAKPGTKLAEVGAGTGFLTELFARQVGPNGKVFALDMNPQLLVRVGNRARQAGLSNVEPVLMSGASLGIPQKSTDVVLLCDVYHRLEDSETTLRSIHRALRQRGELIVVERHRIPGVSSAAVLEQVRAGQEVFTKEIESARFSFVRVEDAPFLKDYYVLRFRKRGE